MTHWSSRAQAEDCGKTTTTATGANGSSSPQRRASGSRAHMSFGMPTRASGSRSGGNPAEIADEMGHSLEVLFSTYAHVIAELKGAGKVSAEDLILEARRGRTLAKPTKQAATSMGQD
jgi:hypothetical protein